MTLAIFDIDGTLLEGSTERRFWRYLARRGHQGPRQVLAYLWFLVRYLPTLRLAHAEEEQGVPLRAGDGASARARRELRRDEILPRLYVPAVQRLQQHLRRGDTVVLLSGTLEPIARALARRARRAARPRHGVPRARRPIHRRAAGGSSVRRARSSSSRRSWRLKSAPTCEHASAYGDSHARSALLEAVANPVAVLPDRPLLATARGNDWDNHPRPQRAERLPQ